MGPGRGRGRGARRCGPRPSTPSSRTTEDASSRPPAGERVEDGHVVRSVAGTVQRPAVPLPGLRPGAARRHAARRRLAGGPPRRPAALAHRLLAGPRPPRRQGAPQQERPPLRLTAVPAVSSVDCRARHPPEHRAARRAARRRAAHRRRPRAGRRARAPAGPAAGRDAGLPAPAADAGRLHGQPPAQEGELPAAGPGRPRRAALQHPRHDLAARHQPGRVRQRRRREVRRRSRSRPVRGRGPARASGWSAGRSAPTWR